MLEWYELHKEELLENTLSIAGAKEHLSKGKGQLGKDFTIAVDTNTTLTYTNPIFALGNITLPEEGTYADREWKEENWGTYSEVTKSDQGNIDSLVLEFPSIIEEKIELMWLRKRIFQELFKYFEETLSK